MIFQSNVSRISQQDAHRAAMSFTGGSAQLDTDHAALVL